MKLPGVRVRIGRLSDFADALLAEKPNLPVIRGDMPDTWIHGPMCDPDGARLARHLRPLISATAILNTEMATWGAAAPDVASALARASEKSLLYGEHTWGGALYWVTQYSAGQRLPYGDDWRSVRRQGKYQRLEGSWDEHSAYIHDAAKTLLPALDGQLNALAKSVQTDGPRIVVFNPLPWKRTGLVSLPLQGLKINAVRPADGGDTTPLERHETEATFLARDIPSLGYRTFIQAETQAVRPTAPSKWDDTLLEGPFFKAVLDPAHGAIRSLIAKPSGRELVDASAPEALGQYLYERFDSNHVQSFVNAYVKISADWATNELGKPNLPLSRDVPYQALSPTNFTVVLRESAVGVTAEMKAPAQGLLPAVTTRLLLYRDLPAADLELTLHGKAADPWPEAGWISLPLKVTDPRFHLGRLGSIIDPARDIVPGANRHLLALNTGLSVTDPRGNGVGLCAIDNPVVSLDAPGCWKFSRDFIPKRPRVYVNLFNNQWTTNFRLWNSGTWTARVRLWAIEGYENASSLVTPSMEARIPLLAAQATGSGGKLPLSQAGVELSRRGILVSGLERETAGSDPVLRLWEQSGQSGDCQVRLPPGSQVSSVQPVDLRGRPMGEPIAVVDGGFKVQLNAFGPVSLRLSSAKP